MRAKVLTVGSTTCSPPVGDALVEALPNSSGSSQEDCRVSLAPGSHALELSGYGLQGVAEPQGFSVVAAR